MYCIEICQKNSFSLVSEILNKAVELAFQAQIHPALSAPICAPELAARDTAAPAHLGSLLRPMVHTIKPHSICGAGTSHRIPISCPRLHLPEDSFPPAERLLEVLAIHEGCSHVQLELEQGEVHGPSDSLAHNECVD